MAEQYKDQEYLIKIGKRLVEIREEHKLTQESLGRLAEIEPRQIGRIERAEGNTNVSLIKKIADAIGITPGDILNV